MERENPGWSVPSSTRGAHIFLDSLHAVRPPLCHPVAFVTSPPCNAPSPPHQPPCGIGLIGLIGPVGSIFLCLQDRFHGTGSLILIVNPCVVVADVYLCYRLYSEVFHFFAPVL